MLQEKTETTNQPESSKVDQKILNEIQTLQKDFNQVQMELGRIEVDFHRLENQKSLLKEKLAQLEEKEVEIAQKIEDQYGQGSLDIGTGEFIKHQE